MDPNATLATLVAVLESGDYARANELRRDLAEWLDKGGFQPDWNKGFAAYAALLWKCTRLSAPNRKPL